MAHKTARHASSGLTAGCLVVPGAHMCGQRCCLGVMVAELLAPPADSLGAPVGNVGSASLQVGRPDGHTSNLSLPCKIKEGIIPGSS